MFVGELLGVICLSVPVGETPPPPGELVGLLAGLLSGLDAGVDGSGDVLPAAVAPPNAAGLRLRLRLRLTLMALLVRLMMRGGGDSLASASFAAATKRQYLATAGTSTVSNNLLAVYTKHSWTQEDAHCLKRSNRDQQLSFTHQQHRRHQSRTCGRGSSG